MVPLTFGHLDVFVEWFTLLNYRNVSLLNTAYRAGAAPQHDFGSPIAASTAHRMQFSLDYEFCCRYAR